jgi:tRNA (cytidine/uridine-2'-O-)-methyltransferase
VRGGGVLLAPLCAIGKPALAPYPHLHVSCSRTTKFRHQPGPSGQQSHPMQIALYEPDIAQNTGTILRLAACLGVAAHIIEPAGFPVSDRAFRRAGMDYLDQVTLRRHDSWAAFDAWRRAEQFRLVLFTTRATTSYLAHSYGNDVLVFGRESSGVPDEVHAAADARLTIPMRPGLRSLNVAMACAMVVGEALRQTGGIRLE